MKFTATHKLLFFTFIFLGSLWLTGYAVYKSNEKLLASEEALRKTDQVMYALISILAQANDFRHVSREEVLSKTAVSDEAPVLESITHLRQLTQQKPRQRMLVDSLEHHVRKQLAHLRHSFADSTSLNLLVVGAIKNIASAEDRLYLNEIARITDEIRAEENIMLTQKNQVEDNKRNVTMFNRFSIAIFFFLALLTFVLFIGIANYLKQREKYDAETKKWAAELTETNVALEAFSYSVSHDLRAPLRTVIGYLRLILKQYGSSFSVEVRELFAHVENSSKRMNTIIEDLLTLAKSGKGALRLEVIDLNLIFQNTWEYVSTTSHKATIELKPLPAVIADKSMLQQVVINLLSNAIKYSSKVPEPHIEVGYTDGANMATIYIRDNGAGFDMKYYDKLFGAFQRLHGMDEFEGTGVGLLLAKRIIEKHGGKIWAEGKVDGGAIFYFTIPYAEPSVSPSDILSLDKVDTKF